MKHIEAGFPKSKYLAVSELGSKYNLSFSSQLIFGNKIIALDGLKKSLMVMETDKELKDPFIIDLKEVSAITVRQSYGSINQGELKSKGIEEFLKRIDLQFQFRDNTKTFVLSFYDHDVDDKRDREKLTRNAKNWQMILSKMIEPKSENSAKQRNEILFSQVPLIISR